MTMTKIKNFNDLKKSIQNFKNFKNMLKIMNKDKLINKGKLGEYYCKKLFRMKINRKENEPGFDGYIKNPKTGKYEKTEVRQRTIKRKDLSRVRSLGSFKVNWGKAKWLYYLVMLEKEPLLPYHIYKFEEEDSEKGKDGRSKFPIKNSEKIYEAHNP